MILIFLFLLLCATVIAVFFSLNALVNTLRFGLPFVTSPDWAIGWLTENLQLTTVDTVYELGCGDARVIASLAKKFPTAKFIGIEIQWWPYVLAKWRTRNFKNVDIENKDFLKVDLSSATLVYGFFITVIMPRVAGKLKYDLRPGTKVISYGFALPGWSSIAEIQNPERPRGSRIRIYKK